MPHDLDITLAGEAVTLLPERALYWPRGQTLFVADTHWGKAAAFRAASIAVPGELTGDDLARLNTALDRTGAARLVILGDLLHARAGRAPQTLTLVANWRAQRSQLAVVLIRGNHDTGAGDPPDDWDFTCLDEPHVEPPFVLRHLPLESDHGYVLAGHLHPGIRLWGGGVRATVPCFWFGPRVGVLPAFGSFTGLASVLDASGDRLYAVADDEIIPLTSQRRT